MRAPETFQSVAANIFWRAPPLRRTKHNHRPPRPDRNAGGPAFLLLLPDLLDGVFDSRGHRLVHAFGIGPLHEVGRPTVSLHQVLELFMADPRQERGIVD